MNPRRFTCWMVTLLGVLLFLLFTNSQNTSHYSPPSTPTLVFEEADEVLSEDAMDLVGSSLYCGGAESVRFEILLGTELLPCSLQQPISLHTLFSLNVMFQI